MLLGKYVCKCYYWKFCNHSIIVWTVISEIVQFCTWGIFMWDTAYSINVIQWSKRSNFFESQWNVPYPIWKCLPYGTVQSLYCHRQQWLQYHVHIIETLKLFQIAPRVDQWDHKGQIEGSHLQWWIVLWECIGLWWQARKCTDCCFVDYESSDTFMKPSWQIKSTIMIALAEYHPQMWCTPTRQGTSDILSKWVFGIIVRSTHSALIWFDSKIMFILLLLFEIWQFVYKTVGDFSGSVILKICL